MFKFLALVSTLAMLTTFDVSCSYVLGHKAEPVSPRRPPTPPSNPTTTTTNTGR